jgi:membrane protease YdiL (CAAX protease family)
MDSLRAGLGVVPASLVFGVLWSLWHAPLVLLPGTYQRELFEMENRRFLWNFFVGVIPVASGRSIPISILFHSALNGAAVLLSAGQVAKTIASVVYLGIAILVVAKDRRVFGAGPRDFLADPEPPTAAAINTT